MAMVHSRLIAIVESGDRLVDAEGADFPIEAYFTKAREK
jgi:hypothetical protein